MSETRFMDIQKDKHKNVYKSPFIQISLSIISKGIIQWRTNNKLQAGRTPTITNKANLFINAENI